MTAAVTLAGFLAAAYLFADSRGGSVAAPAPAPSAYNSDGLSDAYDGYRASPLTLPAGRGRGTVSLRITGPSGRPATDFREVHTKQVHMYVLRDDLSGYQHLHPSVVNGAWTAPVTIADGGAYRVYLEFVPWDRPATAEPTVLGVPFVIPGDTAMVPVPAPQPQARSGAYTVRRLDGTADLTSGTQSALRFQVLRDGKPAALEPYLGAFAHLSNFEVRTQGLMHLHPLTVGAPADGVLAFHAAFAERGDKRMFLQFRAGGTLHQVAFTIFTT